MTRVRIHYDGDCPICRAFTRMVHLREAVDTVELINLREDVQARARWRRQGLDIDNGFVVEVDDQTYYADEAIHTLALMSGRSTRANRLFAWVFANPKRAQLLYPWLVRGRLMLLSLFGRQPMEP